MGTRSVTIFIEDNYELCRIYRQFDGYPEGHGIELARACDRQITNGIGSFTSWKKDESLESYRKREAAAKKRYAKSHANGLGELAAIVLCQLKNDNPVGNIYLDPPHREISDWVEYVYVVRQINDKVQIDIRTQSGPFPFNLKDDAWIGSYSPKELIETYKEKEKAA
jgi:hypothetical protein